MPITVNTAFIHNEKDLCPLFSPSSPVGSSSSPTSNVASSSQATHSLPEAQLQVLRRFVGGTLGGFLQAATSHPLDTVKAHLQTGSHHGMLACWRHLWKEEGISGLFRGIQVPIFFGGFLNSILFSLNQFMISVVTPKKLQPGERIPLRHIALAAQLATPFYVAVLTPVDRIKLSLQLNAQKLRCGKKSVGLWDCAKIIHEQHSFLGFMTGYFPNLLVHLLGLPAYFLGRDVTRNYLSQNVSQDTTFGHLALPVCSGMAAGVCFWFAAYPFDLIKTKMQSTHHHMGARNVFLEIYRRGFLSLYKGIGVSLVRSLPANASVWLGIEYTDRIMKDHGY